MNFLILLFSFSLFAQDDFEKPELVRWETQESEKRIERSKYKKDFFRLSNQFTYQPNGIVCAPTTGSIVMNALRLGKVKGLPKTSFDEKDKKHISSKYDPRLEKYTPKNFISGNAAAIKSWEQVYGKPDEKGKKDFGFQLRQLHKAFWAHGVKSTLRIVNDKLKDSQIKKELTDNLKTKDDYVVINYSRKSLGQKGGGHVSPLGAYDKATDSFLIMDVNPTKDSWVWVKSEDLIRSMRTFDTVENRGYLLISE